MDKKPKWWDRLNRTFFPVFGPAQLGPGPDGEKQVVEKVRVCPLCGAPMSDHAIVRSGDGHTATRLVCPV